MTTQYLSTVPPPLDAQTLAISVECPKCQTRRGFQMGTSHETTRRRETSGFAFESECEQCGHCIRVTFGWVERKPGWTTKPILNLGVSRGLARIEDPESLRRDDE